MVMGARGTHAMGLSLAEAPAKNKELRQRGDDLNNPRHANVFGILTGHRPECRP